LQVQNNMMIAFNSVEVVGYLAYSQASQLLLQMWLF